MSEEIIKVETLPEPSKELLNKIYVASKKTSDKLPKGKYKCCGSGFRTYLRDIDKPEELREYILEKGEYKEIPTGEFEEVPKEETPSEVTEGEEKEEVVEEEIEKRPVTETIKFLVIGDKEFFAKMSEEKTCYIKSDEEYKELVIPTEEEIKGLAIKTAYKMVNYFWSAIVEDEGE